LNIIRLIMKSLISPLKRNLLILLLDLNTNMIKTKKTQKVII